VDTDSSNTDWSALRIFIAQCLTVSLTFRGLSSGPFTYASMSLGGVLALGGVTTGCASGDQRASGGTTRLTARGRRGRVGSRRLMTRISSSLRPARSV